MCLGVARSHFEKGSGYPVARGLSLYVLFITLCYPGGFFKKVFSPETYRIYISDIPQGNAIDQEKLERLYVGMNKDQVVYLLGTSLVQNVFRHDRWDYVHYIRKKNKPQELRRVTLYFEGDELVRIVRYRPLSKSL